MIVQYQSLVPILCIYCNVERLGVQHHPGTQEVVWVSLAVRGQSFREGVLVLISERIREFCFSLYINPHTHAASLEVNSEEEGSRCKLLKIHFQANRSSCASESGDSWQRSTTEHISANRADERPSLPKGRTNWLQLISLGYVKVVERRCPK